MAIEFRKKPGLVIYLTAGDPDLVTTRDIALAAIDNGADVIELGVPFSDPLADGPVIQRASERAVARGTRLTDVLGLAKELRAARPAAGLVLFSYLNPVVRMGMKTFCARAAEAGADGVLLTDMIVEEAGEYLEAMREHALAPVFLAAPTSPDLWAAAGQVRSLSPDRRWTDRRRHSHRPSHDVFPRSAPDHCERCAAIR